MIVKPGEIYWLQLESAEGSEPRIPHPHVVVQMNGDSVVVCALTSNLKRVSLPGNVLLEAGEVNLSRQSVVEVSKVFTVEITRLGAYIGTLSASRVAQIMAGMRFVQTSFLDR